MSKVAQAGNNGGLKGARIVVGVGGGIAAFKAVEIMRGLMEEGAQVRVAMTEAATSFVGPLTFEALTRHAVLHDVLALAEDKSIDHVEWGYWTQCMVVAPATADLMARMAAGMANDAVTALAMCTRCPMVICPAMEPRLWSHPFTQRNVRTLEGNGAVIVQPEEGRLASGRVGVGRLAAPERIVAAVRASFRAKDLEGKRVVVTAGPTQEPLDPVRVLTNRSTGKMGLALACAARDRGAAVTLIHGPLQLFIPAGMNAMPVVTAQEMLGALQQTLPSADLLLMAAAVSDWRPEQVAAQKVKKGAAVETLTLVANPDLLASTRDINPACIRVGFAAETEQVREHAREKLTRKRLHFIVANDVSQPDAGFGVDTNRVTIIRPDGEEALPLMSKSAVADAILDRVEWPVVEPR